ncbi:hypothetical protein ACH42_10765 [Endozoicomonas sp. (ex Bugula neritina AB1)]|nr:hypothetical protein ACH42_10765 [Endozoicomonas sp. (ex Bugula neritina AB1)]
MKGGIGDSGGVSNPTTALESVAESEPPSGSKDGKSITPASVTPKMSQLNPSASGQSMITRPAAVVDDVTPTPGLKSEPEDDGLSYDALLKKEEATLEEVGQLMNTREELRVTDLALAALEGEQEIDPRHKLDVKIQMPNEPPPPIQLIPMSKEVAAREDIDELKTLAYKILKDFKKNTFVGYKPQEVEEKIDSLKQSLEENANKMHDKDPSKPSKWEDLFKTMEQKQVYITAKGKEGDVVATSEPEEPKLTEQPESEAVPVEEISETTTSAKLSSEELRIKEFKENLLKELKQELPARAENARAGFKDPLADKDK